MSRFGRRAPNGVALRKMSDALATGERMKLTIVLVPIMVFVPSCLTLNKEAWGTKSGGGSDAPRRDTGPMFDYTASANYYRSRANMACEPVVQDAAFKSIELNSDTFNKRQFGVIATTAVGGVGSIATAIVNVASSGNQNATLVTGIACAAVTGLVGAAVVLTDNPENDTTVSMLDVQIKKIVSDLGATDSGCMPIREYNAEECQVAYQRLEARCSILATRAGVPLSLPVAAPPPVVPSKIKTLTELFTGGSNVTEEKEEEAEETPVQDPTVSPVSEAAP